MNDIAFINIYKCTSICVFYITESLMLQVKLTVNIKFNRRNKMKIEFVILQIRLNLFL